MTTKAASEALEFETDEKVKRKRKKRRRKRNTSKHVPDEQLTDEQLYHRNYYRKHRKKRSKQHKTRWKQDEEYRQREIERGRRKRAEARKKRAGKRFEHQVESKRKAVKPTRRPKYVEVDGERCFVFGSGTFAREIGREDATIRTWMKNGVLPGCSIWVGGPGGRSVCKARAHFSEQYMSAVRHAVRRLYEIDGRGDLKVLARLVREEFAADAVPFVVEPGGEWKIIES